ncbi:Histidine-containing phosphotransfer protein 4 [Morella rubra]|uniref:Histidine-containing phosphotransfer protein n=1 Tax=Morella rubra TaxID=262757 RepID=A0A6A1VSB1_9ROSI|nr:Histidine-containing phosphotransfer protein 4 [Morella rubra]KAB1214842.1 Histidine-containing phosphotransfer protein 4 [Morella rubra]
MDIDALRQQIATMRQSLIDEEILDCQFIQLEQLQDSESPNFVEETITVYLNDSPRLIAAIEHGLEAPVLDYPKLDTSLHRFKSSSSSIGANKVKIEINKALQCCWDHDKEGCRAAVHRIKEEHSNLRSRVEAYFEVIQQARLAETSNPPK